MSGLFTLMVLICASPNMSSCHQARVETLVPAAQCQLKALGQERRVDRGELPAAIVKGFYCVMEGEDA